MQDAFVGNWAQESHLSAEILGSLRDLNHRFLDLIATRSGVARRSGGAAPRTALWSATRGRGTVVQPLTLGGGDDYWRCGRAPARFRLPGSYESPSPPPAHQDLQERHQSAQSHRPRG